MGKGRSTSVLSAARIKPAGCCSLALPQGKPADGVEGGHCTLGAS